MWMHCASLGEFEQGRPLLENIRKRFPHYSIVLTFFSPSGYEIRKIYPGADAIFYLPMDGKNNAIKFIEEIQPDLVLWIKYEYWYHYLNTLKIKKIPVLLVSGIFRESQPFFQWYGKIWKEMLTVFTHLFVQNESSFQLIKKLVPGKVSHNGDTRFDRVKDIAENFKEIPQIEQFCGNSKVVVAGSTWEEDESCLIHYVKIHPEIKFIIAPHEIDIEHIKELRKKFKTALLYSQLAENPETNADHNVLIIDNIGMLSRLYCYAMVTYVGGGFNSSGIHNVLEAAVYGRPVVFGPVYEKFTEAKALVEMEGGFSIKNAVELEKILDELFASKDKLYRSSQAAKDFVSSKTGATAHIMNYIAEKRLLIS